jgi:hypothetical protein
MMPSQPPSKFQDAFAVAFQQGVIHDAFAIAVQGSVEDAVHRRSIFQRAPGTFLLFGLFQSSPFFLALTSIFTSMYFF